MFCYLKRAIFATRVLFRHFISFLSKTKIFWSLLTIMYMCVGCVFHVLLSLVCVFVYCILYHISCHFVPRLSFFIYLWQINMSIKPDIL